MNRNQRRAAERRTRKSQKKTLAMSKVPQQTVSVSPEGELRLHEKAWTPFIEWDEKHEKQGDARVYENSRYIVHVYPAKQQADGWPPIIHVSIRHIHNIAITDFRDFQRIKTELLSPEAEAVQIFPAESRLVDSCNQYHLWVFAPTAEEDEYPTIPVGYFYGRDVLEDGENPDGTSQR
jgi:hypothetical protein